MVHLESTNTFHTPGHHDCPACRQDMAVMYENPLSPGLTFRAAFEVWIAQRTIDAGGAATSARYISPRGARDLRQYARAAAKFFGSLRLEEIHVGHLRRYQQARAVCDRSCGAWAERAGANLIRKEVGVVERVMKAAGAWGPHHEEFFEPLRVVEPEVPRALSPEDQRQLLNVAASRPEWRVVYWWAIVALQTTCATNELRKLKLGDLFLDQGVLQVRGEGAKNKFRIRTIPFGTPQIVWALEGLMERARKMGARTPYHYLFPVHVTGERYDPCRPMTEWGLRKPWEAVRAAAGLEWLRMYDMRHTAITRMAEAGVPIQVIMSYAGHISERMQRHYTAISTSAKRRWAAVAFMGQDMAYGAGMAPGTYPALAHGSPDPEWRPVASGQAGPWEPELRAAR